MERNTKLFLGLPVAAGVFAFVYSSSKLVAESKIYTQEAAERKASENLDGDYLAQHSQEGPAPFARKSYTR